jgi:predicted metalloendopeptidase
MENMLKILDDQEQLMASDVEKVFTSLANIPKGSDWTRYTLEAQKQIQAEAVEKSIQVLHGYRNKYIEQCEKAIANTKMTVSAPQIVDSYSLMSNKYKLISQPLEKQIEVLSNMTNQNDFEIMKGIILERLTDQEQIRQVMKVELPTEEKLKKQAIGQLKFRTANIDWIPGIKLNRAVSIQGLGLRNYLNSFF